MAAVSLGAPSRNALSWTGTYLLGFFALFVVADITEHRSFADLIGFSVMSILFFLEQRGLIIRPPMKAALADDSQIE